MLTLSYLALPMGAATKVNPTHTGFKREIPQSVCLDRSLQQGNQDCRGLNAQANNAEGS